MSDKILSRERFLVEINQSIAEQRCTTPLDLHDAALRADRDTWKAQAEAQPDAVQGLVDALQNVLIYRDILGDSTSTLVAVRKVAANAIAVYEEAKAKGGE